MTDFVIQRFHRRAAGWGDGYEGSEKEKILHVRIYTVTFCLCVFVTRSRGFQNGVSCSVCLYLISDYRINLAGQPWLDDAAAMENR
jgi:hypothetical protein